MHHIHCVLEIVPPLLEAFDDGMQLFVMRMVTHFVVSKLLAIVRNQVPVALSLLALSLLTQYVCHQL
jgi:hypothetical protein